MCFVVLLEDWSSFLPKVLLQYYSVWVELDIECLCKHLSPCVVMRKAHSCLW